MGRSGVEGVDGVAAQPVHECGRVLPQVVGEDHQGNAVGQLNELLHRGVEADGRVQARGPGPPAVDKDSGSQSVAQLQYAAMRDSHTFRPAGGAGGVDDVGEVLRSGAMRHVGRIVAGDPLVFLAEVEHDGRRRLIVGDEQAGAAVADHVRDAVGGVVGIEGQIGTTGLEHGQQGHDEVGPACEAYADEALGPDAARTQFGSDSVGAAVEIAVAELLIAVHHGDCVRRRARLSLDQIGQHAR